ncbi:hypothetical protein HEK616_47470 [Streptomyces nigrescens]|uniref:HTH luxR-type domain-containing protein n=2 Tax=Streptomyces TaxID=1883 RepID=A0ABN6QYV2_STRNI|nr:LuxR C-terminal-related transcriptional regulator [Streptomyces nigrescens]MEE4421625.1 LuxR C-terminal-related transcriptional regulator [Streptomyces sp. DSM 41528]BDM71260.1 hypothetical protein HEK616_47470 [Streptomyces nigrescens]
MLENLGIDPVAERVYRALIKTGHANSTVPALANELRMPPDVVRSALHRLSRLSLIQPADVYGRQRPVRPVTGLNMLLAKKQWELAVRQRNLEETRKAIELVARESDDDHTAELETIHTLSVPCSAFARLKELVQQTQVEMLLIIADPAGEQIALNSRAADRFLSGRDLAARVVGRDSIRNRAGVSPFVDRLTRSGGQIRTLASVPPSLLIVDRAIALVFVDDGEAHAGALEVRGTAVVGFLTSWFEHLWAAAEPFALEPAYDDDGLSGPERKVLRALAEGQTDQVVARELGLSVRTIRRMVSGLMLRLDAHSRFQAGVRAAARGWVWNDGRSRRAGVERTASGRLQASPRC